MAHQRHLHRQGLLPPERFRALALAGFCFSSHGHSWHRRFSQLAAFHSAAGHCALQRKHEAALGPEAAGLYDWAVEQRQLRRAGLLDDNRVRRLDGLGFVWLPAEDRWEQRFRELAAYREQTGHCRVPPAWPVNQALAAWVQAQHAAWRARSGVRSLTHSQEVGTGAWLAGRGRLACCCWAAGSADWMACIPCAQARLRKLGFEFGRAERQRREKVAGVGHVD